MDKINFSEMSDGELQERLKEIRVIRQTKKVERKEKKVREKKVKKEINFDDLPNITVK